MYLILPKEAAMNMLFSLDYGEKDAILSTFPPSINYNQSPRAFLWYL